MPYIMNVLYVQHTYPVIEYPHFRYNDDTHQIINVPLKSFEKAPSVSEVRFRNTKRSNSNQAVVASLQRYLGGSDDIQKYASRPRKVKKYEQFEKTRDQSNAILFQVFYCSFLVTIYIMWFFFFRK